MSYGYPGPGAPGPAVPPSGHAGPAYAPAPARPPLPAAQARAARLAGGLSFSLLSLGWWLLSAALAIGAFAAVFAAVVSWIARSGRGRLELETERVLDWLLSLDAAVLVVPLVVAGLLGAALMAVSLVLGRGLLARSGHPRPGGTMWAASGIAIAASWILGWIPGVLLQLIGSLGQVSLFGAGTGAGDPGDLGSLGSELGAAAAGWLLGAGVVLALSAVLTIAIGVLSWWWMAHALRGPVPARPAPPASVL